MKALFAWTACGLVYAQTVTVAPREMQRIGSVDERFQAYNIEMIEVTGGRFWKPYASLGAPAHSPAKAQGATPAGMDPNLYEYRPPIDLSNVRLRKLAAALGPSYVRVSGTWANTVYFQDSDAPPPAAPPAGFSGVLTRREWKDVIDFAHATDALIVTSFAVSAGTRDAAGVWTPEQARAILAYTKAVGGSIAAAEFMNEPNITTVGGAPKGYDAAAYARDVGIFRRFLASAAPGALLLGPGSVMEGAGLPALAGVDMLRSEDLLRATGPVFDVFSYHLYPAVSKRCAGMNATLQIAAADARSRQWLMRPGSIDAFYAGLRDRYEPGKPIWITETADAACGGNPWASTFLDTFRYVVEHAELARRGVQVIAHNTLASSDYGLLDEKTFEPRPNYWAAVLWRSLMGTRVLDAGSSPGENLHLYAHCLRGRPGGVAVLAVNADAKTARELTIPMDARHYTLTAPQAEDTEVQLNGKTLRAGPDGGLPPLDGAPVRAGRLRLEPASITFLAFPDAGNAACR